MHVCVALGSYSCKCVAVRSGHCGVSCSSVQAPPSNAVPPKAPPTQTNRDNFQYMKEFSDNDFQRSGGPLSLSLVRLFIMYIFSSHL